MDDLIYVTQGVLNIGEQMKQEIIARHKAAGEYVTGKTSSMLRIVPTEKGFQLMGWPYSGPYEEGRKPGKMPPTDDILLWAEAKGIQFATERQAQSWAYCVARKIAREGTKRYRMAKAGQPVDVFETPIANMKEALKSQYLFDLSEQVKRTLLRMDLNSTQL